MNFTNLFFSMWTTCDEHFIENHFEIAMICHRNHDLIKICRLKPGHYQVKADLDQKVSQIPLRLSLKTSFYLYSLWHI